MLPVGHCHRVAVAVTGRLADDTAGRRQVALVEHRLQSRRPARLLVADEEKLQGDRRRRVRLDERRGRLEHRGDLAFHVRRPPPVESVAVTFAQRVACPLAFVVGDGVEVAVVEEGGVALAGQRRQQVRFRRVDRQSLRRQPQRLEPVLDERRERGRLSGWVLRFDSEEVERRLRECLAAGGEVGRDRVRRVGHVATARARPARAGRTSCGTPG